MLIRREIWDGFAVVYNTALTNDSPRELVQNPNLPIWIKNNYLDAQVMAVRRQVDSRSDVVSLGRLLKRVSQYPQVLSRDRYAHRTSGWQSAGEADEFFDSMVGEGRNHIDPNIAKANLRDLRTWTSKVVGWAHEKTAHFNEVPRALGEDPTIGDLHHAVDVIVDFATKYREMILGMSIDKRVTLLPWMHAFSVPWVPPDGLQEVNRIHERLERMRLAGEPIRDEDFGLKGGGGSTFRGKGRVNTPRSQE